jgi:hypothetical protein
MKKEVPSELRDVPPPARKVACPIFDFHVHAFNIPETRHLLRSMELYGVEGAMVITNSEDLCALRACVADGFSFCLPLDFSYSTRSRGFIEANLDHILTAPGHGVAAIKLWFQPRLMAKHRLKISEPRLRPLFDAMCQNDLLAIVHIADPDVWYEKYYSETTVYGTKDEHLAQFEAFLSRNEKLTVVCAHLGGNPEHLGWLSRLLDTYPNLYLDTAATKWITRELSRKPEESRQFMIRYADRILFGTDNFVHPETNLRHFSLRYYVHRMFWETDAVFTSPIADADAEGPVRLTGLNLPEAVLRKMYCENAHALLEDRHRS